jgi:hypothetical protein
MRCNCGIGFLQDSPQVVRQAVRYLTDWDRLRRNPHALLAASKVIDRLLQQEEDRLLPESDAEPVLISPL